ncbi:MAG TPA: Rrf2 family transcriptional regulator [Acidimicrobiales bacterium]|nr:Rrf2 family transcriptional regulator [Acidimicrobiales bacterium]
MNLTLSKRGDYVVRSAICLARAEGQVRKIREVVAEMEVPATFASQILADLVRAGLATSKAGKDGGYRLARSAETISLLEVVEAGEGTLVADRCAMGDGPCRWESVCPLHATWGRASAALREVLASTTLAELVERDRALEVGTYPVPTDAHRLAVHAVAFADSVQVELGVELVTVRLQSTSGWLAPLAEEAHADGEALRMRIGPGGPGWLAKTVVVTLGDSRRDGDEFVVPLRWEATGPSGLFPRMEAELSVRPVDAQRAELHLSGWYHPPLGRAGHVLDDALLHRLGQATVRAFLRRVAQALEGAHASTLGDEPGRRRASAPATS